jgi:putative endonuclease
VDHRKRQRLAAAARQYLARLPREPACRFDLIAMQGDECTWVRGAFEIA